MVAACDGGGGQRGKARGEIGDQHDCLPGGARLAHRRSHAGPSGQGWDAQITLTEVAHLMRVTHPL
jgi:hypothetical protein